MIQSSNFIGVRSKYREMVERHEDYVNNKKSTLYNDWKESQNYLKLLENECIEFMFRTDEKIKIHGGNLKGKELDNEYKQYLKDVEDFKSEYIADYNKIQDNTKLHVVTRVMPSGKS